MSIPDRDRAALAADCGRTAIIDIAPGSIWLRGYPIERLDSPGDPPRGGFAAAPIHETRDVGVSGGSSDIPPIR